MAEIEKRHHLHIVLTHRQYRLLCSQAKQCRLTKRAYLASLIEGQPVKSRPSQEIKDLRTEIHHIGNNINQIARSVNAGIAKPEDARRGLYLLDQVYELMFATVYKGNIIKNLIMDCQSYTKYRPNETTGGIFVSWRRKEELPTGA